MKNEEFISRELDWLLQVIVARIQLYFKQETDVAAVTDLIPPTLEGTEGPYAEFIRSNGLGFVDRLYLALAVASILRPQIMDCFCIKNSNTERRFVEFGCVDSDAGEVLPTLFTAVFLLAGDDVKERIGLIDYFSRHALFSGHLFDRSGKGGQDHPVLRPTEEFIDKYILSRSYRPDFSEGFPAKRITTALTWDDLVLDGGTLRQVEEIGTWLEYGERILDEWDLRGRVKNGYRVLFYGPPGTGKTLTASLLGKTYGRDVYRVDLSLVVSKYIGETEKNLSKVFDQAENKGWILFFDEADALFGKLTGIKDSHDRYANQEVAFLLQRVEDYGGLVILSTNQKSNMDEAFTRRFQNVVQFQMPDAKCRERLWRETFSRKCVLADDIDLKEIASRIEISGGSIVNVVQFCSMHSMAAGTNIITLDRLMDGIRREFWKEGKILSEGKSFI